MTAFSKQFVVLQVFAQFVILYIVKGPGMSVKNSNGKRVLNYNWYPSTSTELKFRVESNAEMFSDTNL